MEQLFKSCNFLSATVILYFKYTHYTNSTLFKQKLLNDKPLNVFALVLKCTY